mmetsp:Transcript_20805/g.42012  ORF Transcript_20805/g.42012 Transcript_20805/m.42012 type:complete len:92 (+) Transcript_20805:2-277(+)
MHIGENLHAGRQGSVSPLFERTVQTISNMSNVMSLPDFDKSGFSQWAGEALLTELENVGACGSSARMLAATAPREQEQKDDKCEELSEVIK